MRKTADNIKEKKEMLTIKQFCKELSISTATARNWIKLKKIHPDIIIKDEPMFYPRTLYNLKKDINTGKNQSLKSRRNKIYIQGNEIYKSYISETSQNHKSIKNLTSVLPANISEDEICLLLAECAIQLFTQKENIKTKSSNLLSQYLTGNLNIGKFKEYIDELINDKVKALRFINNNQNLFGVRYFYKKNEDIIGLLYISVKHLGNRKTAGMYYTPANIVQKLISNLFGEKDYKNKKIFDPCCGSGNFLLQLPENITAKNIYATDTDNTAVKTARINLALKFGKYDIDFSKKRIRVCNYLTENQHSKYDYILGNPPWGANFTDEEKNFLKKTYKTAQGKNIESFDVFIEKTFENLKDNGNFSFVLPESILNVKAHEKIRNIIKKEGKIKYVEFLNDVFDKVQCPSIILKIRKGKNTFTYKETLISDRNKTYRIKKERNINLSNFSVKTTDEEEAIINKIFNLKNAAYLKNNANFALGIVTGNNKKYISTEKDLYNEIILKGSDIYKYKIKETNNYIRFEPEKFQQTAPENFYRAKEKLFYRFISDKLVFAYDNKQTLSLNSCNILIPKIKDMNIKYVLAVLNSKIAGFVYKKHFNSVKVLRSHLEKIPIVIADNKTQTEIVNFVDKIILEDKPDKKEKIFEQIEKKLCKIYQITNEEKKIINEVYLNGNNFLRDYPSRNNN